MPKGHVKSEYRSKNFREIKLIENNKLFDNGKMRSTWRYYAERLKDYVKKNRRFAEMQCLW